MHTRVLRLLIGCYIGIIITIAGSFVLYPGLFFDHPHRGLSFYGNYFPTIIPYALGLITSVACLLFAAYCMPQKSQRLVRLRYLLLGVAAGLAGLLVTPEQANQYVFWAHALATIFLFVAGGGTALWVLAQGGTNWLDQVLLTMLLVGSALSVLSSAYIAVLGFLSLGQVLAMNATIIIIIRGYARWTAKDSATDNTVESNVEVEAASLATE